VYVITKYYVLYKTHHCVHLLCNCTKMSTRCLYESYTNFNFCVLYINFTITMTSCPLFYLYFFTLNTEIHSHNTRSLNNLHLPSINNPCGTRCVKFNASRLWNNLPKKLKTIQNYNTFKKQLKNYLLTTDSSI